MKAIAVFLASLVFIPFSNAQAKRPSSRLEEEYYATAYAQHYKVPLALVYAIIDRESNWRACTISAKGAIGVMQLMPGPATRLQVRDRCNVDQNISGGIRYLAWLMQQFHNDLRLVSAAYYAGEGIVARRGLNYRNRDVVKYVAAIRTLYMHHSGLAQKKASSA